MSDETMRGETVKIGAERWYKGKKIVVVEGFSCTGCVFNPGAGCVRPYGYGVCTSVLRTDSKNVHYEYKKASRTKHKRAASALKRKSR